MNSDTARKLAINRAEELGYDVYSEFVLPPFYSLLNIESSRKPKVVMGGRGCGKTMLLRYLSHESTFSKSRARIEPGELNHIGLYWRADTQFASLMRSRGLDVDEWNAAFRHLAAVLLGSEILTSLRSIADSNLPVIDAKALEKMNFDGLSGYSREIPESFGRLEEYFVNQRMLFESWVNDIRSVERPVFLPGPSFLNRLISLIREQQGELSKAVFFVYIDEYENLSEEQQKLVNTWVKHSEPPLIYNLALKRNGFKTKLTEGEESISEKHDYRTTDLEKFSSPEQFRVFAAEILLLRLDRYRVCTEYSPERLRELDFILTRSRKDYASKVLSAAKEIFPSYKRIELAEIATKDKVLKGRLMNGVKTALKRTSTSESFSPCNFIRESMPEASIIIAALLNRKSLSPVEILHELDNLAEGENNKFTGKTEWIHNNFIGCFLELYSGLNRPCPIYGGFSTYCLMSRGNLRHFLELCHHALAKTIQSGGDLTVSVEKQAEAARQVAADLLSEVRSFGPHGNRLYTFILRLGSLYSISQQRPSQSEPEVTHFCVKGGDAELENTHLLFLSEAIKWSVLFEDKGTKKKSGSDPEGREYVLNPIYAPYFHISYRKKRRLELPASDVEILIGGAYEDGLKSLLKKYERKWAVDLSDAPLPLFQHLEEN